MRRIIGYSICVVFIAVACGKTVGVAPTAAEQLEKDITLIDEYLAANNINAIRLESGMRYIITENADGPLPTKDNCVKFRYAGYELYDSVAFDYNTEGGLTRPLKGLVGGMQIGLKLFPEGSKGTIYMPSAFGYGTDGSYTSTGVLVVSPNAVLRFDVEIIKLYPYNAEANYCTNNSHKLEEIRAILHDDISLSTLQDIGCTEELAEDRHTIEGNSFMKAGYVYKTYHVDCFADDSGLEVEALDGAPGVISAMYAGPQRSADDNMDLLLKNLSGKSNRRARFKTVITLIIEGRILTFDGILDGTILAERRGTGGFGYDPLFLVDGSSKTLAEMTMEEKNQISHRALAVRKLANFLNAI